MIPQSLLGLVIFALTLGPGIVFWSVAQERRLRHARSTLGEAAELVVVGVAASAIAALAVLAVGRHIYALDPHLLADQGSKYLLRATPRALVSLLEILLLGSFIAWLAAHAAHFRVRRSIAPGSVWHQVLAPGVPLRPVEHERKAFVHAELRDHRVVSGWIYAFTGESDATRSVALHRPIFVRPQLEEPRKPIDLDIIVLPGDEITVLGIDYAPTGAPATRPAD